VFIESPRLELWRTEMEYWSGGVLKKIHHSITPILQTNRVSPPYINPETAFGLAVSVYFGHQWG
jgi:hypothetical protein